MAGKTSAAVKSSFLEQLERRTSCPKCGERYNQPKLLPCNHSVCKDCLTLKKGVRKGLNYIVTCPACDTEAELPKNGLDSLPTAFFKQRLSKACSKLQHVAGGKGCEECGNGEAELAAFCRDCERVLCAECDSIHGRMASLSTHTVITIEDFSRELGSSSNVDSLPAKLTASKDVLLCTAHKEQLKFYCTTCHVTVCHDCTVSGHVQPRHKVEQVEELVQKKKSELVEGVTVTRGVLADTRKLVSEKVSIQQDIAEEKRQMCQMIDDIFQELQQKLEQSKRKLVKEAEKKAAEEIKQVSQELDRFEKRATELESLIEACSETLQHSTDQEFMTLRRDLQARLKEVTKRRQNMSPLPTELPNLFLPLSISKEIDSACNAIQQNSLVLSHTKSRVQKVKSAVAEINKEVQIVFSALTEDGRPCIEHLQMKVKVIVPRFELEVESTVTPTLRLGTYQVSFTPTKKGEHLVLILVGGEKISSCPYKVPVRSMKMDLGLPEKVLTHKEWAWGVACGSVNRHIYITENYNHCVSIWDKHGKHVKSIGQKGQKPGQIFFPTGIAVNQLGDIYVADGKEVGRVQKFSQTGQLLAIFVELNEPFGIMLNAAEDRLYVCNNGAQNIMVFDSDLKLVEQFGELSCSLEQTDQVTSDNLQSPHSIALDSANNIYVTDTMNQQIHVYNESGTHVHSIGHPHDEEFTPSGLAIEDEQMFVADRSGNQVVVFTTAGEFVTAMGSYGTSAGQFHSPSGVTVDVDGYLYVCDYGNSRVQIF